MGLHLVVLSSLSISYLEYLHYRRLSTKSTLVTYRSCLNELISFTKDCDVESLSVAVIDSYAEYALKNGISSRTLKNKLSIVRSFVKWLYAKDYINFKPEAIELPRYREEIKDDNFLEIEEEIKLINACSKIRNKAIIMVLLRSGLRVSELVQLKLDDIHDRSIYVANGKGRKQRITFIDEETKECLKEYIFSRNTRSEYVFPNKDGSMLSRQYVARLVSYKGEKAKLVKHVTPHTLRHTFATRLLWYGARVEDVQPLMGHTNLRTTKIYLHYTNQYLQERYDIISKAIAEKTENKA